MKPGVTPERMQFSNRTKVKQEHNEEEELLDRTDGHEKLKQPTEPRRLPKEKNEGPILTPKWTR
jgi:hypothetical protein